MYNNASTAKLQEFFRCFAKINLGKSGKIKKKCVSIIFRLVLEGFAS